MRRLLISRGRLVRWVLQCTDFVYIERGTKTRPTDTPWVYRETGFIIIYSFNSKISFSTLSNLPTPLKAYILSIKIAKIIQCNFDGGVMFVTAA